MASQAQRPSPFDLGGKVALATGHTLFVDGGFPVA
jgi:hypothetical protein